MSDDGGAAFPLPAHSHSDLLRSHEGMTLRDYFAGQALVALFATDRSIEAILKHEGGTGLMLPILSKHAYMMADHMLNARNPNGEAA